VEDNILVEVLDNILAEVVDSVLEADMEAVEEEVDETEVLHAAVAALVVAQRKTQSVQQSQTH